MVLLIPHIVGGHSASPIEFDRTTGFQHSFQFKDLLTKLNRTGHVSHIERDMRSHESLLSNKWEGTMPPPHFYRRRTP